MEVYPGNIWFKITKFSFFRRKLFYLSVKTLIRVYPALEIKFWLIELEFKVFKWVSLPLVGALTLLSA